jgi:hypothetical protein
MITELHLGNFKAFAAPVRVPIRPLTLIFGPNSAGKSSVIHGLALGHEGVRVKGRLDIARTKLGGDAIDLGGFRQFVHRRALDQRVTWGIEIRNALGGLMDIGVRELKSFFMLASFGLPLDDEARPLLRAKPKLASYQLTIDNESRFRMSRRSDGQLHVDEVTPGFISILRRIIGKSGAQFKDDRTWSEAETQETIMSVVAEPGGLFPRMLGGALDVDDFSHALYQVFQTVEYHVDTELGRLSYLGPLRSYPPRHMAFSEQDNTNWTAGGGRAWDRMRKSKKLRDAVNLWLGSKERLQTPYKISLRRFIAPITAQSAIGAGIDEILFDINEERERHDGSGPDDALIDRWDRDAFVKLVTQKLLHDHNVEGDDDLVLVDMRTKTTVSHRDVGIGISQVLPVLVEAYGNKNRLVAIEQPEIHLHPRLQAELGDVFIESALGERKNTFLLETHSEHLLLRVMRRMRETAEGKVAEGQRAVRPEDVMVLYVEPDGTRSIVRQMPLNERGELVKAWPGGFFEEGLREVF